MNRPILMLSATLMLCAGVGASGAAYAADGATFNQCWGETTKQFAQAEDDQAGIGEHSKDPPGFNPGDGGREGVGNVSKNEHGDLSEGGQGTHAVVVGAQMELPECDGPDVP